MPRDTSDIGSHGLEQGGANLGNDISRSISKEREDERSTLPVVGSGSTENAGNENATSNANTNEDNDAGDGSMPDPETLSKEEDSE